MKIFLPHYRGTGVQVAAMGDAVPWAPASPGTLAEWWDHAAGGFQERAVPSTTAGVGDVVGTWRGTVAATDAVAPTDAGRPVRQSTGLVFDTSNDGLLSTLSPTKPYTFVLVEIVTSNAATRRTVEAAAGNVVVSLSRTDGNAVYLGGTVSGAYITADSAKHVGILTVPASGNCRYWLDGTEQTAGSVAGANWGGAIAFGYAGANFETAGTTVRHLLVYSAELGAGDIAAATAWGLSV